MEESELIDLINDIAAQAERFLKVAGEFYPFGWAIEMDGRSIPLGIYFEDASPTSDEVISTIESGLAKKIKADHCKAVAICIDVVFSPPGNPNSDALEIRVNTTEESANYFLLYVRNGDEIVFGDLYSEPGTLNLYKDV